MIAPRLFAEQGYTNTTVADIAAAAGVATRTVFRYFANKVDALWSACDQEVAALRESLTTAPAPTPILQGIRQTVLRGNYYTAKDIPELRARISLATTCPRCTTAPRPATSPGNDA